MRPSLANVNRVLARIEEIQNRFSPSGGSDMPLERLREGVSPGNFERALEEARKKEKTQGRTETVLLQHVLASDSPGLADGEGNFRQGRGCFSRRRGVAERRGKRPSLQPQGLRSRSGPCPGGDPHGVRRQSEGGLAQGAQGLMAA
jgi:hypothetical protein